MNPIEQFQQTADYLDQVANNGGHSPEGSVGAVINQQSPEVRQIFKAIKSRMDSPRDAPFQPKRTPEEWADKLGFDSTTATAINDSLDGSEVLSRLQERMPAFEDNSPPSRRDNIEAAFDLHQEGN